MFNQSVDCCVPLIRLWLDAVPVERVQQCVYACRATPQEFAVQASRLDADIRKTLPVCTFTSVRGWYDPIRVARKAKCVSLFAAAGMHDPYRVGCRVGLESGRDSQHALSQGQLDDAGVRPIFRPKSACYGSTGIINSAYHGVEPHKEAGGGLGHIHDRHGRPHATGALPLQCKRSFELQLKYCPLPTLLFESERVAIDAWTPFTAAVGMREQQQRCR